MVSPVYRGQLRNDSSTHSNNRPMVDELKKFNRLQFEDFRKDTSIVYVDVKSPYSERTLDGSHYNE